MKVLLKFQQVAHHWLQEHFTWWDLDNETYGRWMTPPEIAHYRFVRLCYALWDVEWDERWGAWPHCCTQAGCWMHCDSRYCSCRCRWCALALLLRGQEKGKDGARQDRKGEG